MATTTIQRGEATRILAWLREHAEEIVGLTSELARSESPSIEPAAQRGPFAILAERLEALGFAVSALAGREVGDHLLAEGPPAAGGAYQLLLGHMDTVWPAGTLASMPVRRDDGRLRGPGVYDMKAGLAQMIVALEALAALGLRPPLRPVVLVNTDEELGSPESREHVRRLAAGAARALVLEPSYGPAGELKTQRKGVGRFSVRIKGRASHAGLNPEGGASAILEAAHQVQRLFALNDRTRGITVNVGTIDGGLRANVVAPEVLARVDARVRSEADMHELEQAILALAPVGEGVSVEVRGGFDRPPLELTPRNRALWEAARDAATQLGLVVGQAAVGGASDGNLASVHTATLDGLGAVGDGAHAVHEQVDVARMPERAALLAVLLMTPEAAG